MCLTINVLFLITCKLFKDCTALILVNIVTVAMSSRAACALRIVPFISAPDYMGAYLLGCSKRKPNPKRYLSN